MLMSKLFSIIFPVHLCTFNFWAAAVPLIASAIGTKASSSSNQSTDTEREQTISGTEDSTGTQTQTTLSPEVQEQLTSLLTALSGGVTGAGSASEQAQSLVDLLTQRAGTSEADTAASIQAILSEQSRSGQLEIDRLFTDLAQASGSSQGSLVRQAAAEGQASLASQLASTGGQLNLQARDQTTNELMAGLQGLSAIPSLQGAGVSNLVNLASVLKGATTTATTTQSTSTEQQLTDLITSLTSGASKSKSGMFG